FGEMLGQDQIGGVVRVMRYVIFTTLIAEAIGAAMLYPMFRESLDAFGQPLSASAALGHAVFHSVSAFCNAGFALYETNLAGPLASHWQILGVIAPLIVLGGLGFIVLRDVLPWLSWQLRHHVLRRSTSNLPPRFSLHTKLVLVATLVLIVFGAVATAGLNECSNNPEWAKLSASEKFGASLFQSVTTRTAGFNTIDMDQMPDSAKFIFCGLMTIGGSPGGTAGGMKTITVVILVLAVLALLRRRSGPEAFGRTLPAGLIHRALTLATIYLALLATTTLLLSAMLPDEQFIDVMFEASSACGTVGLSTGVTTRLTPGAELVITFAMFLGRLGPLTLIFALAPRKRAADYIYPEEPVAVC
ncbi:MAG: TrkH family potassium uptake protein, partial [Phycisphaerales bacterium]|nr:TrkH family potassium uptake protein [Phycisphaerales bacterium]